MIGSNEHATDADIVSHCLKPLTTGYNLSLTNEMDSLAFSIFHRKASFLFPHPVLIVSEYAPAIDSVNDWLWYGLRDQPLPHNSDIVRLPAKA